MQISMKKAQHMFGILRVPLDALAVAAALLLSFRLREESIDLIPSVQLLDPPLSLPSIEVYLQTFAIPGVIIYILIAAALGLYSLRLSVGAWREIGRVIAAALIWIVVIMVWYFLLKKQLFYSRMLLIHATCFIVLFVMMVRVAVILLQRSFMRYGIGVGKVVSIGSTPMPRIAKNVLRRDRRYKYIGHTENLAALKRLLSKCTPDLVMQTDPNPKSRETVHLIEYCRSHHIGYAFLPPVFADVPHQLEVERIGLLPMMRFKPTPLDGWGRVSKRLFDIVASSAALIILSPLLLVVALIVLVDAGWPIFYVSRRIGEHGNREIPVLKFRSMVKNADALKEQLQAQNERQDGPLFKMRRDPRITKSGRFLRRFDLDELPQLLNVLAGHMSLVGPRPHLPEEVSRYKAYERRVFAVRPGLTGLAQVSGRSDLSFKEEVDYDIRYVEEWSLRQDLWILWRTVFVVLGRVGEG